MTGADITLEHVTRRYGVGQGQTITAVDELTLHIDPGSVLALTGPSGSGKSTLLHLIGALDRPDTGSVAVDGTDLTRLSEKALAGYRRRTGFVFQRYNLLPALTVLDNVLAPVLPYRADYDKRARGEDLLTAVGLADRARALPSRLSGGQQQRVAIARALINQPSLLLADEPTGNLDTATGDEIIQLLLDLRADRGMTVLLATHDSAIASRCDRIIRLRDGKITEDDQLPDPDAPHDVLERLQRPAPA